jgi:deoxyribodipyrimidine photo-lyase
MSDNTVLHWFRLDLRLSDVPALAAAERDGARVLPVYILDDNAAGEWAPGSASRWWLHHSLERLGAALHKRGGKLLLRRGDTLQVLKEICEAQGISRIHCTRRYEPWAAEEEQQLHKALGDLGVTLKRFPGALLHEPGSVLTQAEEPFKVFTPFWRACRRNGVAAPVDCSGVSWRRADGSETLTDWQLTPRNPDWATGWSDLWSPGEEGATERLDSFLSEAVAEYAEGRNLPGEDFTSRLSPHLHHGEISPRQVWARCEARRAESPGWEDALDKFQAELGWREFSYHLLHFFPHIPEKPFKENFSDFPWSQDKNKLRAWQRGNTGYPIVDAGMRELWSTGYMHNRVRMVVASFLCKHLLLHWRHGEDWFWDTLVDADLASNGCSWQWVAGSGADAAPYFRIFNPVTQGEKFDKDGRYVRRWVPELAELPDKYLHKPWEAPEEVLENAGVTLGTGYPEPIVDHRSARQGALDAYEAIKGG